MASMLYRCVQVLLGDIRMATRMLYLGQHDQGFGNVKGMSPPLQALQGSVGIRECLVQRVPLVE